MRKLNLFLCLIVTITFLSNCSKDDDGDVQKIVEMTVYPETGFGGYKIQIIKKQVKMKRKIFLLVMGFISFNFANAQFAENNAIYATGELNLGNYYGMDFNLIYV